MNENNEQKGLKEEKLIKYSSIDKETLQVIKDIRKNLKKEGKKIKRWYYDSNFKLKIEVEELHVK